ncbi:MAG: ATP-dependent RNA helicase HrpA, partial [Gammaproteobacteria bacterium]|nr:ATP-dependent RNA helicase HrpA [Gammaproteobacteria bacterium]
MSQLPVAARGEEIAAAIARHQVIVLCGETGSGKTTQVPQICLRAGRGTNGLIGHTQPRRLAARSVAVRIAEETGTAPGTLVGYKVRFSDETGPDCRVKLMTDGILLQELRRDRDLRRYDTLIIDEAHERSVNIDFLLGYLKTLLPRRPDLRVVIMSATIDPQKFSAHFDDAPVIEVSGRTYPVEIRYQPGDEDSDSSEDIVRAVAALIDDKLDGDILVFLPGERDIRDAATMLRRHFNQQLDILPLYARLAAHEQDRVFSPGKKRRVVLATNVAETSITVPRIAAVIDTGLARINRYSHQSKIQRLPIEPISQASANQRAGRCGRVRDGTCIRLYSEDSFEQRDAYTDPEILRINLAQVLLRMADLRLGDIEAFPFPDPPDPRYVRDGLRLLGELRAIDDDERLTASGRKLARLAVDPRFGTMLINASRYGALREMLIITAALNIPDPADRREVEDPDPADDWRHPRSELIAYLQLWDLFHRRQKELNGSQLRKWCRRNGLAFMRLREWQDIHRQLRQQSHELRLRFNKQPAKYRQVHLAALSGLLSQVGHHREGVEYDGARGLRFRLVPGARQSPPWIVAATIQQTHRAYASQLAAVQPAWIERAATHLVRRRYSEPYWEAKKQRVYAGETVSLYGLTLRADRPVDFTGIDPRASMLVFTREGLARGLYRGDGAYRAHNDGIAAE